MTGQAGEPGMHSLYRFAILTLLLASCTTPGLHLGPTATSTTAPTASHTPTALPSPTPTVTQTRNNTPTLTASPTPTATPDARLASLDALLSSEYWPVEGLPEELAARWAAYKGGQAELTGEQERALEDFLLQWDRWARQLAGPRLPGNYELAFKARPVEGASREPRYALSLVDGFYARREGVERLFLVQHPQPEQPGGMILAPRIEGLQQRISDDGEYVEYQAENGETLLLADAVNPAEEQENLAPFYGGLYEKFELIPRYKLPQSGVDSSFYLIDKMLSLSQIQRLNEAVELFDRPEIKPLKPYVFAPEYNYQILDDLVFAAGVQSGENEIWLDRQSLFEDKILLAGVIAHEAGHIIQGDYNPACAREVGKGDIPDDFYDWEAGQLVEGLKSRAIGTAHLELWVYGRLNANPYLILYTSDSINNKGRGYWPYCR